MLVSEGLVLALRDGYPVSRGHSLIVPRRHLGSFGEVSPDEQSAMLAMLRRVRAMLDAELRPDGCNIGINDGAAAGQTAMHVHMHVIPRYRGDRPDPRGGSAGSFPRRPTIGAAGRMSAPPGNRSQLEFPQQVQRIFDEGEFVATYRFGTLIALVDQAPFPIGNIVLDRPRRPPCIPDRE